MYTGKVLIYLKVKLYPKYQINRLQHIQNALAQTVVQVLKFQHITPILHSLHWLKVSEWIEYEIISHKILNTTQPSYLYDLVSIQPPRGHNTLCYSD